MSFGRVLTVAIICCLSRTLLPGQDLDREQLLQSAEEILTQVIELRRLSLKHPVKKGIKSKSEIRSFVEERIRQEYPSDEIRAEGRLLKRLGVLDPEIDFHAFTVQLLTEQIAGYYDPLTKTFYIADWIPLEIQKPVMAHELTHALQDQHFDLSRFLSRQKAKDDLMLAHSSVIEGEGLAVMLDYVLQPLGRTFLELPDIVAFNQAQISLMNAQFPIFGGAPAFLKDSLMFPYIYGARFVQAYVLHDSWTSMNAIYQDMPASTEQILHPEKYFQDRDEPQPIDTAAAEELGADWTPLYNNVLGEFSLFLVLREFVDLATARKASEGWDGDRAFLYQRGEEEALVWETVWDSEQDAEEFFQAYLQLVRKKYPQVAAIAGEDLGERVFLSAADWIKVRRKGVAVRVSEIPVP